MLRYAACRPHLFLVRETAPARTELTAAPDRTGPTASLDPFDDADALEELADEIASLAAHLHAATHRMLTLVAEFDRRRGWELGGHRSCAHWLALRTGLDLGAAREKVRVARALVGLPGTSASMARGELSFSAVRALTRVANSGNEADLLELARGCTTAQLERMVRGWKRCGRADEAELERRRHESRGLSVLPSDDGMYELRGRLDPEVGALLMRALEAAGDALYRARPDGALADDEARRTSARQRRADAIGLLAERALAAGFGRVDTAGVATDPDAARHDLDPAPNEADLAPNEVDLAPEGADLAPDEAPLSGTRAERYQVVLHVEASTLSADGEPGRSELEDGTRVSAETSRRVACDAGLVRMAHAPDGSIRSVGRRTRTIPPALRRALEARDRGCRFPGCALRFTDAHHVRHWADGGETSLGNCLLLCAFHHGLVHEGGWRIAWWGEGRPVFVDPRGGEHFDGRWAPPLTPGDPVQALVERNRAAGARPDGWTVGARWKREADIPDEVYFGALEAMG